MIFHNLKRAATSAMRAVLSSDAAMALELRAHAEKQGE
jgi:hypothetical protein